MSNETTTPDPDSFVEEVEALADKYGVKCYTVAVAVPGEKAENYTVRAGLSWDSSLSEERFTKMLHDCVLETALVMNESLGSDDDVWTTLYDIADDYEESEMLYLRPAKGEA